MKSFPNSYKKLINDKRLAFLEHLKTIKGYSDLTLKTYDDALKEAFIHVEIEKNDKTYTVNLMPYRLHIADKSPKTIAKKLSAFRSFVSFCNKNNFPLALVADNSVKVPKTLPKPIPHKHIAEALEVADFKQKVVLTLIYTLGVRISELQNIKLQDISNNWVVINGKGNKQRNVPLIPSTKALIEQYLEKYTPKIYLFEKNGEKLSQNSLRYTINKVFSKIGLKVTPHQLRHSFATVLLNEGAGIADVSELLGHSSMATTQIYTKLGSALKKENYLNNHPLCRSEVKIDR